MQKIIATIGPISSNKSALIKLKKAGMDIVRLNGSHSSLEWHKKVIKRVEYISKQHLENNFFLMTGFLMTGLFDFVSYAVGLTNPSCRKFFPALLISIVVSNPHIVALGAGILEGGKKLVFIALIGIFILALITSKLRKKVN